MTSIDLEARSAESRWQVIRGLKRAGRWLGEGVEKQTNNTEAVRGAWSSKHLRHGEQLAADLDVGRPDQQIVQSANAWALDGFLRLSFSALGDASTYHGRATCHVLDATCGVAASCT